MRRAYGVLLEGVEELDNVSGSAYVDEQQLGQLVVRQLTLGQHPSTHHHAHCRLITFLLHHSTAEHFRFRQ